MQNYELFFHYLQLTKLGLCLVKRDYLVNFYILLEKAKNELSLRRFDRSPQNLT